MNLSPLARQRFFDSNGLPLNGGKLYSYAAGTDRPLVTYSNSSGTTNTNPVILDSHGYCDLWIDPTLSYKFVLKDSSGNVLWTKDNISLQFLISSLSSIAQYQLSATGSVPRSLSSKLGEMVSAQDFGALADFSTDNTSYVQTAVNSFGSNGGNLYVAKGVKWTYSSITHPDDVVIYDYSGWDSVFNEWNSAVNFYVRTASPSGKNNATPWTYHANWHPSIILNNQSSSATNPRSSLLLQQQGNDHWQIGKAGTADDNFYIVGRSGTTFGSTWFKIIDGTGQTLLPGVSTTIGRASGSASGSNAWNFHTVQGTPVYDGADSFGSYGALLLNANAAFTSGARKYLITNSYGANKFAIIRSADATTNPALGTNGAVTSGVVDFSISNAGVVGIPNLTTAGPVKTDSSGNISSEAQLGTARGGTGQDTSASTGVAKVSSGTWSVSSLVNADVSGSAAIAYSKLALTGSILNADLAGSIAASKLVGSDIATVGTVTSGTWSATAIAASKGGTAIDTSASTGIAKVAAGTWSVATLVNADVSGSAAIAYSKLALTGAILNADLAGSIAYSKLSLTGAILNADLAGSIAASKLVGTDIATVGTLTAGATGAGFTVALSTSTITGTLAAARLPAHTGDVTSSAGSAALSLVATTNATLTTISSLVSVGTITTGVWNGTAVDATHGGTAQTTWTTGDILYASASNTLSKLSGNISATMSVLTQTGNASVSAAPVWTTTTGTGNFVRSASPTLTGTITCAAITASGAIAATGLVTATAGIVLPETNDSSATTPRTALTANPFTAMTGSATITIQGIVAGTQGQMIVIYNRTGNALTLTNLSGAVTSTNRIICPGNSDFSISSQGSAQLIYDGAVSGVWAVVSK